MRNEIAVVAAVHNNRGTLPDLCHRVRQALGDCRIILVDDQSTDDSLAVMHTLGVEVIALAARRGQSEAIRQGLSRANGRTCCVLDADLQDPPEALPAMLEPIESGRALVSFSMRDQRRRLSSRLFRRAMRLLFPTLPSRACLCFAIDGRAASALVAHASARDYLVAVIGALGLPATQVPVRRLARPSGRSAYAGLKRTRHGLRMLAASIRLRLQTQISRRDGERANV